MTEGEILERTKDAAADAAAPAEAHARGVFVISRTDLRAGTAERRRDYGGTAAELPGDC